MMNRLLARSLLGLTILVLAALPLARDGTGSEIARATHDGNIHQVSIDVGPPGVNVGVTVNGLPAVVDRDGDGINDAEGYDTPDPGDTPGICGNGIDDDLADSDADTTPDAPDGSIDDGCQVTLSALETCIEIIDDGVLNADEDTQVTGQDRASIDITLGDQPGPGGGVPPARLMSAWQYTLQWDVDVLDVDVQNPNFLILAAGGGQPFTLVGPSVPVTASPFVQAAGDAGPKESGGGVLARLSIEGNAAGLATLSFDAGGTLVQDAVNVGIPINTLNTAQVAVSKDVDGDTTIGNVAGESFGCPEPADLKIVSVSATAPQAASAGTPFDVVVDTTVHNNGPASNSNANVAVTLSIPPDCFTPINPQNVPIALPSSQQSVAQTTFPVACGTSFHTFSASSAISSTDIDNTPGNNFGNSPVTDPPTVVTADADLKAQSVSVAGPGNARAGTPFDVSASAQVHNNGPQPASADAQFTLTGLPADCTSTSGPQTVTTGTGPVSAAVTSPTVTFSVTCTQNSNHDFTVTVVLTTPLHVTDATPGNNSTTGSGTISVYDAADLKVNSVTVMAPASASPNAAFNVEVNASLHNNGPYGPVITDVTTTLPVPSGCTATPAGPQTAQNLSLPVSTATAMPKHTFSVTCTTSGAKAFSATVTAATDELHVSDPTSGNATASAQATTNIATPTSTPTAATATPTATPEPNPCRGAAGSSATPPHDVSLDRLSGAGRIRDSQAKTYTAIVTNHNLTGAEDIQVCFTVVPMFGCSAPEIDVALPYDATPGEPDNEFVDVSGDGIRDSVALAVAHGILPDRSERVKATVFFSGCPPAPNQQQTPFDYIVQADACHEGDPASKGFFGGACPGINDGGNDPNQINDAPIQKAVDNVLR